MVLAGALEFVPLVGAVLPLEVLRLEVLRLEVLPLEVLPLEPLLQAATTSPAATTTAIAGCREQLRSKPIFPPEAS